MGPNFVNVASPTSSMNPNIHETANIHEAARKADSWPATVVLHESRNYALL